MAAGATYTNIQTTTLGTSSATITLSSIPSSYTDLVLVVAAASGSGNDSFLMRVNGDSSANYSGITLDGSGSAAASRSRTGNTYLVLQENGGSDNAVLITNIFNYSNTSTYKEIVGTGTQAAGGLSLHGCTWRSTAAVNSITLYIASSLSFAAGTVVTLYGIAAA